MLDETNSLHNSSPWRFIYFVTKGFVSSSPKPGVSKLFSPRATYRKIYEGLGHSLEVYCLISSVISWKSQSNVGQLFLILENALRRKLLTALQRVLFILLAAHSLKQKLQIAYNRTYEGYMSRLLCKFVIGLFSYQLRFVRTCFQL